jgi:hypothetical protein
MLFIGVMFVACAQKESWTAAKVMFLHGSHIKWLIKYLLFLALEGRVHHVSRIERMNVVRREGRILLRLVDWLIIETFSNRERLNNCSDNVLL